MMTQCVRPRAGAAFAGGLAADSVHAREPPRPSGARSRAPTRSSPSAPPSRATCARARPSLPHADLYTIPNPVDMTALDDVHDAAPRRRWPSPYVLYAGKLATNKGVQFLLHGVRATRGIQAGRSSSPATARCAPALEADARARGIDLRVLGWLGRARRLGVDAARARCWRFRPTDRSR